MVAMSHMANALFLMKQRNHGKQNAFARVSGTVRTVPSTLSVRRVTNLGITKMHAQIKESVTIRCVIATRGGLG
jgi:hypothetical protein